MPGFKFNAEEWEAEGQSYETQPVKVKNPTGWQCAERLRPER